MKHISKASKARWTFLILAALAVSSCTDKIKSVMILPNERPVVRITAAPIDSTEDCTPDPVRSCYSLTISWAGHDPDGRVDHYLYAIDPPSRAGSDTVWTRTDENEQRLLFRSGEVIGRRDSVTRNVFFIARDFHVFVIKAVDDRGSVGPSTARAFFSFTQAPSVQLLNPAPSALLLRTLTPSVRFVWSGDDPDGVFTDKPVKYKYLLLGQSSEFPLEIAIQNPDSLRRYYAPHFFGWDSTSSDTTEVQFTQLTPNQNYVFVVVAFDEAGAYSPIFSLNNNMIRFKVGYAGSLGPKITVFNELFEYNYNGGYCACPQAEVFVEVPADAPVNFNWFATTSEGASIRTYRWALDIPDVSDNTGRNDEFDPAQFHRWSSAGLENFSVRFPGFSGFLPNGDPRIHRLYIEAEDNVGLKSLAIIRFRVVAATFERLLGIVDDTRFLVDKNVIGSNPPCAQTPRGRWPMAAELDTFLYAKGGNPYPCPYPAGTLSQPGLFNGYPFDTLGTRVGRADLTVRLSELGKYQRLIWMTDAQSANYTDPGTDLVNPMTALRYMSSPGRFNTVAAYVKQGGRVWFMGGGIGLASMLPWNDNSNDIPTTTFSINATRRELASGRMMFDLAGWQSEFRVTRGVPSRVRRFTGRYEVGPAPRPAAPFDFSRLPPLLELKTQASGTDPFPPLRTNSGEFYQTQLEMEFLQAENHLIEDVGGNPNTPVLASVLDTLYDATSASLPPPAQNRNNVIMTYYHGSAVPQGFVFSGFSIWNFRRANASCWSTSCCSRYGICRASVQPIRRRRLELAPAMRAGSFTVGPIAAAGGGNRRIVRG